MNWSSGLRWLTSFRVRRARDEADDRAGMGTAFGLDASMAALDGDDRPVSVPPPDASRTPWEHRLTRRSSL